MNVSQDRIDRGLYWQRAWSLISGCSHAGSPGCDHCWSATQAHIRGAQKNAKIKARYGGLTDDEGNWTGEVRLMEQDLGKPGSVRKPTTWAVWNDLFHPGVPFEFIWQAFSVMWFHERHSFLILTKRPKRMAEFFVWWQRGMDRDYNCNPFKQWPLPNIFLGVTVEHPDYLHRIDELFKSPAVDYYLSAEPMLAEVNLETLTGQHSDDGKTNKRTFERYIDSLGWIICGAETGPGKRPMELDWARNLRDQCQASNTPFFFKRDDKGSRELDGRRWEEFPR